MNERLLAKGVEEKTADWHDDSVIGILLQKKDDGQYCVLVIIDENSSGLTYPSFPQSITVAGVKLPVMYERRPIPRG